MATEDINPSDAAADILQPSSKRPVWPELSLEHPLSQLASQLPSILDKAGYNEVFGVRLERDAPFHTKLILQKFLRANANDVTKAREQLTKTLEWRRYSKPRESIKAVFDENRFDGLGYVVLLDDSKDEKDSSSSQKQVVTFNIYGAVKDNKATFEDIDGYVHLNAKDLYKVHGSDVNATH